MIVQVPHPAIDAQLRIPRRHGLHSPRLRVALALHLLHRALALKEVGAARGDARAATALRDLRARKAFRVSQELPQRKRDHGQHRVQRVERRGALTPQVLKTSVMEQLAAAVAAAAAGSCSAHCVHCWHTPNGVELLAVQFGPH